ncbi:MAG: response regulator [Spirochaetales bacterium]|nr:response regulator [Spirochaetales bacterium]
MRILIVDDHEENLYLLKSLLEGNGYEVVSAGNGAEAFTILEDDGIEMIISDILMPVMDGFQLCRKVRNSSSYHAMPFIVYTATYTGPQDEELALKIGADRFIMKPCEPDVFLKAVKDVAAETSGRKGISPLEHEEEEEIVRLYSERLILKLEKKMREAELEMEARKKAEAALRESRDRLMEAQRIAGMGDFTIDIEENVLDFSEPLLELLKYGKEQTFGPQDLNKTIHHPEDVERITKWFEEGINSGSEFLPPIEYRVICFDGEIKYVRTTGVIKIEQGKPVRIVGTVQNITEYKQLEEKLKENVDNLKQARSRLLEQARWLQALNSVSGEIARNNSLDSIFHISLGHLEESFEFILAGISLCPEKGSQDTLVALSPSGHSLARGLGLKLGDPCPLDEITSCFEFSGIPQTLDFADSDDTRLNNNAVELIARMRKKHLESLTWIDIAHNRKQAGFLFMIFDKVHGYSEMELRFLKGMMEYLSIAIQNRRLYDDLQESYTQLKKSQHIMMEQERIKAMGQMASGIAHDINNTLVPITLYTEALLNSEIGRSEPAGRYLETIQSAVRDIEETVRRLRAFYKREKKEVFENVDIGQIIETAIEMTRPRWKDIPNRKGIDIELKTEIMPRVERVSANPSEMREAIINLIFNAVDAMPGGGSITIGARPYENESGEKYLAVEVTDEGKGMSEEQCRHCLEPFYTTKGDEGSGLGLAMVSGTMKRHMGKLMIDSNPEKGTTIRLLFPMILQDDRKKPCNSDELSELPPLKILYVDDKPELHEVLQEMLGVYGHKVETFREGEDAVRAFKGARNGNEPFQLVITDMGMPHMDGEEVARLIKEDSPQVPVILLSGWGEFFNDEGEYSQNIDKVLSKPPTISQMICAIHGLLHRNETNGKEGEKNETA